MIETCYICEHKDTPGAEMCGLAASWPPTLLRPRCPAHISDFPVDTPEQQERDIDQMSPFEQIKGGLEDARAYAAGDETKGRVITPTPTSQSILEQAQEAVKDRHERYGDCTEVFAATNEMFAVYRTLKKGASDAHDTAVFNIIQKLVRIGGGQNHPDNWIDIAGYAGTGAEVSNG